MFLSHYWLFLHSFYFPCWFSFIATPSLLWDVLAFLSSACLNCLSFFIIDNLKMVSTSTHVSINNSLIPLSNTLFLLPCLSYSLIFGIFLHIGWKVGQPMKQQLLSKIQLYSPTMFLQRTKYSNASLTFLYLPSRTYHLWPLFGDHLFIRWKSLSSKLFLK